MLPTKSPKKQVLQMTKAAAAQAKKPQIRIAVVESDPLRFIGFRALFDASSEFELTAATMAEIATNPTADLILLGSRGTQNLFDVMASLKASRPDLRIIVTGSGADDETILKALAVAAVDHPDAATDLGERARGNQISDAAWNQMALAISGNVTGPSAREREGPGRERDDRRPGAQRSGARLRARLGRGAGTL